MKTSCRSYFIIAKLEMQPKSGQFWAISSKPLNITCTYNGADSQDVNWSYNGEIPVFRKRLETRSDENGVHSISGIYKSKAVLSDSGNYSCSVGDFNRTMMLRVIEVSTTISSNILKVDASVTFGCGVFGVPVGESVDIFWSKEEKPIKYIPSLKDRYTYYKHTKTLVIHKTVQSSKQKK
ncbi:hypothetical protein KUTeg_006468 [Tegillarca granosa]|uniref:Ig-like domain-containing protein n=1 Tax=Tegillarca granosa TaxID=220873 RepID=A0ABQ9FGP9_TEGGR|nr:hypothetical protein KUTeg_006468 [Tegillarca granosa]